MKHYLKIVNKITGEEKNIEFDSLQDMVKGIQEAEKNYSSDYDFYIANEETINRK